MQRSTGHQTSAAAQRLASSRRPFVAPSNTTATRFPSPTGVHGSSNGGVGLHLAGINGSPTSAGFYSSPSSGAGFHSSLSSGPGFQLGSGMHSSSPRGGPSPDSRPSFGPFSSASSASSMASGPSSTYSDLLHSSDGFINYMMGQNSHFVRGTSHVTQLDESHDNPVDNDRNDGDEEVRTEARLIWKSEEDGRVMSAWLKHSIDPIGGNNKKSDKYWTDVMQEYNQATVKNRWRTAKQVKDRWHKINKLTNSFNDCWVKARRVYTSGYSDEMWLDKAHKFFEDENKGLRFQLMNVWYMVRNEAKWISYNDNIHGKRKEMENGSTQGGGLEDVDLPRPMGQKAAKRAALEAKGKYKASAINVDELDRFEKIQNNVAVNRMKALEMQGKIHNDKIEASKIALQAAKEQKEAKMIEAYSSLLQVDASGMPDDVRAEHVAALKCLRMKLFSDLS